VDHRNSKEHDMNRRVIALLACCAALAGGITLTLYAQERPAQPDRPRDTKPRSETPVIRATAVPSGQPGQPPRTPAPPAPETSQPTRLQFDVFELACTSETLATFDLDQITIKNPAPAEVLARLAPLGKARLLARVDTTVDLTSPSSLTHGQRVPVVQDVTVSKEGKTTPSATYQNIGMTTEVRGRWVDDKTDRADFSYKLELSNVAPGVVEVANSVKLPVFVTLSGNANVSATSGVPVWTMTSSLPTANDDKAAVTVTLARMVVTRLSK
jgi:hypothetical protein